MIILDKPYVSPELLNYAAARQEPVLDNAMARICAKESGTALNLVPEAAFAARCAGLPRLYTCSENSLEWIYKKSGNKQLIEHIEKLKDKAACREALAPLYRDFFFCRVSLAELAELPFSALKVPCVLKPAVGFSVSACTALKTRPSGARPGPPSWKRPDAGASSTRPR